MMNQTPHDFAFLPLPIRKHRVIDSEKSRYRVYQATGEFRTIEAKTAYEAFKVSGFKDASRIVRLTNYVNPSIHKNELTEVLDAAPAKVVSSPKPSTSASFENTASTAFVAAPPESGAPIIQPNPMAVGTMPLSAMQKPAAELDGIEEISSVSTPIQIKVPNRSLASQAPGAAPQQKTERTMLSVQDIDKLLGK